MARIKLYPHQRLMRELKLQLTDLPDDLQKSIVVFNQGDAKEPGYEPELEPISENIAKEIQAWWDEETEDKNCPCQDPDVAAIFVLFYKNGQTKVTRAELKSAGFDTKRLNHRGRPKQNVEIGDYQLVKEGKGRKEVYKIEESE